MDVYARELLVKSRQADLLREANEARLAKAARMVNDDDMTVPAREPVQVRVGRGLQALRSWHRGAAAKSRSAVHGIPATRSHA